MCHLAQQVLLASFLLRACPFLCLLIGCLLSFLLPSFLSPIHTHPPTHPPTTYKRGAPKASGILSIEYLRLATYIIGTPGIFLSLLLRSLSQVATIKHRCWLGGWFE